MTLSAATLYRVRDWSRLCENNSIREKLAGGGEDEFGVRVRFRSVGVGEARNPSKARAITYALARAVGIEVEKSL